MRVYNTLYRIDCVQFTIHLFCLEDLNINNTFV